MKNIRQSVAITILWEIYIFPISQMLRGLICQSIAALRRLFEVEITKINGIWYENLSDAENVKLLKNKDLCVVYLGNF